MVADAQSVVRQGRIGAEDRFCLPFSDGAGPYGGYGFLDHSGNRWRCARFGGLSCGADESPYLAVDRIDNGVKSGSAMNGCGLPGQHTYPGDPFGVWSGDLRILTALHRNKLIISGIGLNVNDFRCRTSIYCQAERRRWSSRMLPASWMLEASWKARPPCQAHQGLTGASTYSQCPRSTTGKYTQ
jgi:hypothetical protein